MRVRQVLCCWLPGAAPAHFCFQWSSASSTFRDSATASEYAGSPPMSPSRSSTAVARSSPKESARHDSATCVARSFGPHFHRVRGRAVHRCARAGRGARLRRGGCLPGFHGFGGLHHAEGPGNREHSRTGQYGHTSTTPGDQRSSSRARGIVVARVVRQPNNVIAFMARHTAGDCCTTLLRRDLSAGSCGVKTAD
ncbi:hypothetical protein FHR84_001087 [Actinopolyspora biskrensis]|uniref:Secreted protein n=1 Tax=Actinopolyspora biskrensis TaxID=1470178 RepID=A0A852Z6E7_9ACTN|nr:hypothetical protein [Actinopolyspora biskrensis]